MYEWLIAEDPVPDVELASLAARHAVLNVSSTLHAERAAADLVAEIGWRVKDSDNERGHKVRDVLFAMQWAFHAQELQQPGPIALYEERHVVARHRDLIAQWKAGDTRAARELWKACGYDTSAWPDELFPQLREPRHITLSEIEIGSLVDEAVIVVLTGDRLLEGRLLASRDESLLLHTDLAPEEAGYRLPSVAVIPRTQVLAVGLLEEALPFRLMDELDLFDDH